MKRFILILSLIGCYATPFAQEPEVEAESTEVRIDSELREHAFDVNVTDSMAEKIQGLEGKIVSDDPLLSDDGMRLNVRDAVAMTLERNPRVEVSEQDVIQAWARVNQAKSQHLPQVSARIAQLYNERINIAENFRRIDLLPFLSGLGGIGGGGANLTSVQNLATTAVGISIQRDFQKDLQPGDSNFALVLNVRQVIYAGGRIAAAVEAAEYLARSEEWRRAVTLDTLEFQPKQAYYDTLLAQALYGVADASVKTFERNLSDAQNMFDVGMVSNFEVLRAKTELGGREADRISARNALKLSLANLRRLIGVPQDTPLSLEGRLDWFPYVNSLESLVNQAYENRPELHALSRTIDAGEQDLRGIRGSYKPQIAFTGEYQEVTDAPTNPDGWLFTIAAEWEIAAGGRRKAERAERKATIRGLEAQYEDLRQLVELEVTQARIQIEDAIAKTARERGTVELALEGMRMAELRFQEGVGTQSDILDADLALTNAESSLVQALRNFAVANAALERAIGKSWYRTQGESGTNLSSAE